MMHSQCQELALYIEQLNDRKQVANRIFVCHSVQVIDPTWENISGDTGTIRLQTG